MLLLIKITSKTSVFYGQIRMTINGKLFKMWKLRSMIVGAENMGEG